MSTPNDTLRAHLEAIRDMAEWGESWSTNYLPHALAALRILDEARREGKRRGDHMVSFRLVPDPGGRAAPPPTTPDWPQPNPPPYPADDEGLVAP